MPTWPMINGWPIKPFAADRRDAATGRRQLAPYLVNRFPIPDAFGCAVSIGAVGVDYTERLLAEQKLARLSRIHAFASGINSARCVRATSRSCLRRLPHCVDDGGFASAWSESSTRKCPRSGWSPMSTQSAVGWRRARRRNAG